MININIHNLVGVGLDNLPAKINSFLKEEFFNFVQNQKLKKNISIKFKSKITIPKDIFRLNKNFYYDPKLKIFYFIKNKKILTRNTHGTGCTLSSAIALFLSCGKPLKKSCELGIKYVNQAISSNLNYGNGNGPINHLNSINLNRQFL